jgi:hypothetical protein
MQIKEFYNLVDKGTCRSQQSFNVVVPSPCHPKWFRSPLLRQGHEQFFSVPEWNDFILSSMDDEYRTFDAWRIVNVWKLMRRHK